jgi:hypothetical protein
MVVVGNKTVKRNRALATMGDCVKSDSKDDFFF